MQGLFEISFFDNKLSLDYFASLFKRWAGSFVFRGNFSSQNFEGEERELLRFQRWVITFSLVLKIVYRLCGWLRSLLVSTVFLVLNIIISCKKHTR